jgi:hypothetical protein
MKFMDGSQSVKMNQGDNDKKILPRSSILLDDCVKGNQSSNSKLDGNNSKEKQHVDKIFQKAKPSTSSSSNDGTGGERQINRESNLDDIDYENDEEIDERKPSAMSGEAYDHANPSVIAASALTAAEEVDSSGEQHLPRIAIETPRPADVLFGRGRPYQSHFGNVRLHRIVDRHKERYSLSRRFDKLAIVDLIVYQVKSGGDGAEAGRFLKRAENGEYWEEVADDVAREKVSCYFRHIPCAFPGLRPLALSNCLFSWLEDVVDEATNDGYRKSNSNYSVLGYCPYLRLHMH